MNIFSLNKLDSFLPFNKNDLNSSIPLHSDHTIDLNIINIPKISVGNLILRLDYSIPDGHYLRHLMIVTSVDPLKVAHCTRDYSVDQVLFRGAINEGTRAFMPRRSTTHEVLFNVYQLKDAKLAKSAAAIAQEFSVEESMINDIPMKKDIREIKPYVCLKSCFEYENTFTKISPFNWRTTHRTFKKLECLNNQNSLSKSKGRSCSQFIVQCFHIAALLRVIESQDTLLIDQYSKKILKKNLTVKTKDISKFRLAFRFLPAFIIDTTNDFTLLQVLEKIRPELEQVIPPIFRYDAKTYNINIFDVLRFQSSSLSGMKNIGHIRLEKIGTNLELSFMPIKEIPFLESPKLKIPHPISARIFYVSTLQNRIFFQCVFYALASFFAFNKIFAQDS